MELPVSISTSGPDPGELMTETQGLGPEAIPTCFQAPIISSSLQLVLRGAASLTLDSLDGSSCSAEPTGRGVFRNVQVQFPLKALCTEVTFSVPSLHTGESECEIPPRPMATEPGWDPRSLGDPLCQWVRRVCGLFWKEEGRCVHYYGWDEMALQEMEMPPSTTPDQREGMESYQQPQEELGKKGT